MRTITTVYPEIADYQAASKSCRDCGKKINRRFKQYQTVNPWNNKLSSDIRVENKQKLEVEVSEWEIKPETCASCLKAQKPDIAVEMLSGDDWAFVNSFADKFIEARKLIAETGKQIEHRFKGKFIETRLGKLAKISWTSLESFPNIYVSLDILRKDKKGFLDQTDYENLKNPGEGIVSNQFGE